MMKNWLIGASACLVLALSGGPAPAEPVPQHRPALPAGTPIESLSLAGAQRLLAEARYRTETVEAPGSPYLKSRSAAGFFFLSLYDCADAAKAEDCHAIELTSGAFTVRPAPSAEELARWNAASPFGFGVLDSAGSPYLRATILLSGGVTAAHIKASLTLWTTRMSAFSKFVETTAAPPSAAAVPNAEPAAAAPAALH